MGKAQKKTGKGRLDKYYKLAKEQGYRARSAFKLIQLNKKYAFLESSRCTIDLCAAPGGWLQVASKYMPVNSIIVGVDLVPIKPIPRVVTFAADITTPHCRNLVRSELKDWKADVVLHDGAPNVGTAWIQDAYSQSELVLMSLKLAVEFLAKGGTFVTKVFRSVDYNNLIWVFNQLFGKVEATKPPSSRNVSAEIFVVCQGYLAPQHVDPKFLDPRHVFKAVSAVDGGDDNHAAAANHAQANVFHPEKKRRQRDGYADGDYILFKAVSASSFVGAIDPIAILGTANKITFDTAEEKTWLGQSATTDDVQRNCEDLKVLGKGDFKALLKWRLALREELGLDNKTKETEEIIEVADVTEEVDEDEQITEELHRLNTEAQARAKRERKRANEVKRRTIQRMQLQMTAPLDIGLEQQDATLGLGQDDAFTLESVNASQYDIDFFGTGDGSDGDELQNIAENVEILEYDDERERKAQELERQLDGLYDQYQSRLRERDPKFRVKQARKRNAEREEWNGIGKDEQSEDDSSSEGGWDRMESMKGIEDDTSESSDDSDGNEDDFLPVEKRDSRRGTKRQHPSRDHPTSKPAKRARMAGPHGVNARTDSKVAQVWFGQDMFRDVLGEVDHAQGHTPDEEYADGTTDDDSIIEVSQDSSSDDELWDGDDDSVAGQSKQASRRLDLVTPETVTLAQQLVNQQTTKTKLINDGFHRYSLNSKEGLPSWFLDDEAQHYKPNVPVTKEAITALRQKQRVLDARPIKKVAEAKARKKLKAFQRMQAAMKKAEGLNQTADMSEREKAQQIEKVLRKGLSSRKKEVKLVVARGVHKGIKGRPKGVKGRYAMVDARMKKEVRAKKRTEKAHKRR